MDNLLKIIALIFIITLALIAFRIYTNKSPLEQIMSEYDLAKCTIYYNTTHAYIDTLDGKHFIFKHDNQSLPIIKKYHPL